MMNRFSRATRFALWAASALALTSIVAAPARAGTSVAAIELSLESEVATNLVIAELAPPSPSPQTVNFVNSIDTSSFSFTPDNPSYYNGLPLAFTFTASETSFPVNGGLGSWSFGLNQITLGASTYYTTGSASIAQSGNTYKDYVSINVYNSTGTFLFDVELRSYLNLTTLKSFDYGYLSSTPNTPTVAGTPIPGTYFRSYDFITSSTYGVILNPHFENSKLPMIYLQGTLPSTGNNGTSFENFSIASVPEPSSCALLVLGLFGVASRIRRSRKKTA